MTEDTLQIPYKAKILPMVIGILFFSACAWAVAHSAMGDTPNSGRRLRSFDPETARVILWITCVGCMVFVAGCVFALIKSITSPAEIILSKDSIAAPRGPTRKASVTIPYAAIRDMTVKTVKRHKFLSITHTDGKLSITGQALPSGMSVEALAAEIRQRI